jgi:hypothetical protein
MEVIYHLDYDNDRQSIECMNASSQMFTALCEVKAMLDDAVSESNEKTPEDYVRSFNNILGNESVDLEYIKRHPNTEFEDEDPT